MGARVSVPFTHGPTQPARTASAAPEAAGENNLIAASSGAQSKAGPR